MKIEKLNDRQIRCTLNKKDLTDRELRLSELAYGSEKAKALFREMMQQAYNEFGFEAEDIPLMIEAIPVSNDCLVLVVTKVDSPEELDTRFSKFTNNLNIDNDSDNDDFDLSKEDSFDSPFDNDDSDSLTANTEDTNLNNVAKESLMNCFGQISDLIEKVAKQTGKSFIPLGAGISNPPENNTAQATATVDKPNNSNNSKQPASEQNASANSKRLPEYRLFRFESLDNIIKACNFVSPYFTGHSVIYKMPDKSVYLLLFYSDSEDATSYNRLCSILSEFGTPERSTYATIAFLDEHMDLILDNNAIQTMAKI